MPSINEAEWIVDMPNWFVEVTGMQMDAMSLKIEVGEYPKIKVNLSIKRLLEELKKDELEKLIKYCEKRLKCPI